ncbi:MAG TPA: hypothetical protein VGQ85_04645 [Candidatus Limnocylindrales bacterium]|nr:hypothetical protein [Candidatus Limnocylindrales bacterium]
MDRELNVHDVTTQLPSTGYVTPRYYGKRVRVSDSDVRNAEEALKK